MPTATITNTTAYPWRTAVSLFVRWSDGTVSRGSGTMVGPNDVITAAHVVYNPSKGRAVAISAIPGQNGRSSPYGIISGKRIGYYKIKYASNGGLTKSQSSYDLAVVGLADNIGTRTGWLGTTANSTGTRTRYMISYPSDRAVSFDNLKQILHWNTVSWSDGVYNKSNLDTAPGSSGAALYEIRNGQRYVVGVNSTNPSASYIDTARFNTIQRWKASNNSVVDGNKHHYYELTGRSGTWSGKVHKTKNDRDRYAFQVNSSGSVSFTLRPKKKDGKDADLRLYDVYGRELGKSTRGGTRVDSIRRGLNPGIYYVEVDAHSRGKIKYKMSYNRGTTPFNFRRPPARPTTTTANSASPNNLNAQTTLASNTAGGSTAVTHLGSLAARATSRKRAFSALGVAT